MAPKVELVGTKEAAELLGVERPRIARWQDKKILPEPLKLACGPIWTKREIEAFGRRREKEAERVQRQRDKRAAARA